MEFKATKLHIINTRTHDKVHTVISQTHVHAGSTHTNKGTHPTNIQRTNRCTHATNMHIPTNVQTVNMYICYVHLLRVQGTVSELLL